jgi:hypothetical protein
MADHLSVRLKGEAEVAAERGRLPEWVRGQVQDWDFSDETYSLFFDIGSYFSEVLRHRHSELYWDFVRKPRRAVDYHRPVLDGFPDGGPLNSMRLMRVLARKILDGQVDAAVEIRRVLDYWEQWF